MAREVGCFSDGGHATQWQFPICVNVVSDLLAHPGGKSKRGGLEAALFQKAQR